MGCSFIIIIKIKKNIKIKTNFLDPQWASIQTYLSLGDAEFGEIIYKVTKLGAGLGAWKKTLKNTNFIPKTYKLDSDLPWDFIEFEINKQNLINQYEKAIENT